jgi:hypothetical protein
MRALGENVRSFVESQAEGRGCVRCGLHERSKDSIVIPEWLYPSVVGKLSIHSTNVAGDHPFAENANKTRKTNRPTINRPAKRKTIF